MDVNKCSDTNAIHVINILRRQLSSKANLWRISGFLFRYSVGYSLTHVRILRRDGAIVPVAGPVPFLPLEFESVTCFSNPIIGLRFIFSHVFLIFYQYYHEYEFAKLSTVEAVAFHAWSDSTER